MKSIREFFRLMTPVEWAIVGVIVMLLAVMAIPAFQVVMGSDRPAYEAWLKVERRSDISYEEWKLLKREGLLDNRRR